MAVRADGGREPWREKGTEGSFLLPISIMVFQVIRRLEDVVERSLKLDWEQSTLLFILFLAPNCSLQVGQLAVAANYSKSVTSDRLSRLARGNLVVYADDDRDRRVVHVTLTESGKERASELMLVARAVFNETFEVQDIQGEAPIKGLSFEFNESPYMRLSGLIRDSEVDFQRQFDAVAWFWLNYNDIFLRIKKSISASGRMPLVAFLVLLQLKNNGSGMTSGELAQSLLFDDKDNLSYAIKYLLDKGSIVRRRDALDRRVIHLDLTEKGDGFVCQLLSQIMVAVAELQELSNPQVMKSLSLGAADYIKRMQQSLVLYWPVERQEQKG